MSACSSPSPRIRIVPTIGIVLTCAAALAGHGAAAAEWTTLSQDPDLWIRRGGNAKYEFKDGEIIGTSVPNTPNTFLCTRRDYTNFVLELEFKVATNLNSGIQIRSQCFDEPREIIAGDRTIRIPAGRVHGYQVEIDPSPRAWTAGIYDEARRGWLADLKDKPEARAAFRSGEWNTIRVEARGPVIRTWLNDVPAAELEDDLTPAGFIGLQVHGVGAEERPLEVRWRNVRLRELP